MSSKPTHPNVPKRTRGQAPVSRGTRASNRVSKAKPQKKTRKRSVLGWTFKWLFVLGLWGGIFIAGLFAWYAQDLPNLTKNASFDRKRAIIVKAIDGQIVARYGEIIGNSVTVKDLPPDLIHAVLATEDRRFYYHFGLDPLGLARAVVVNFRDGKVSQGGSTITQQLAKNLFLSQERTFKRKIQEAMLAVWLEYTMSKDEILSAYLNRVYLGTGTYGVDAAAHLYFDKPVQNISLRESATLAGMLKAPSRYSPLRNPKLSKERTDLVISAMQEAGYLTKRQASTANITEKPADNTTASNDAMRYYTDWVVDSLDELIGTPDEDLIVETTLNPNIQTTIETAINDVITEAGEKKHISEGAMVVLRPDGQVVALVGGKNYNDSQFNRATQGKRPPGSSFKPLVYLTALENGWGTQDIIVDEPITTGKYRPKNFGGKYLGPVTLEQALTYSLNTVSYQLIKSVGPSAVIDTARRMGITADLEPNLSLALGSNGISLLEMAGAYGTIANGGLAMTPYAITKITSEKGDLYYERSKEKTLPRVFRESDIQNLTSMMNSVIQYGTGQGAYFGMPMAGKTGTSDDSRDALFIGFTRELVGAVWIGNDNNAPMKGVTGGSYPATIWREVMRKAAGQYPAMNPRDFAPDSSFQNMLNGLFSSPPPLDEEGMPPAPRPVTGTPLEGHVGDGPAEENNTISIPESARYND